MIDYRTKLASILIAPIFLGFTGTITLQANDPAGNVWAKSYYDKTETKEPMIAGTGDGGLVLAGKSKNSEGLDDFFIIKLRVDGSVEWQRSFSGFNFTSISAIRQTRDGGFACAGTESTDNEYAEAIVMKLGADGSFSWYYRFSGSLDESFSDLVEDRNGNLIVTGYSSTWTFLKSRSSGLVLKLDKGGKLLWQRFYGGESECSFSSIVIDDGGYTLCGTRHNGSFGNSDIWVIRIGESGDIVWQKTYGGKGADIAYQILRMLDGGYTIALTTTTFRAGGTSADVWLFRLDGSGEVLWQKLLPDQRDVGLSTMRETEKGHIMITVNKYFRGKVGNTVHACLVKLDKSGNPILQKRFRTSSGEQIWPNKNSLISWPGGILALCGVSLSFNEGLRNDFFIIRGSEDFFQGHSDAAFDVKSPEYQSVKSGAKFGNAGLKPVPKMLKEASRKIESKDIRSEIIGL